MVRPNIIKPGAVLVRDAVQVHHAARDGDIRSPRVARMADFILSMLTETERTAFSSRGRPQGYSPPVHRFVRAADAFIVRFGLQELLQNHREDNEEERSQSAHSARAVSAPVIEEHVHDEEPPPDPGEDPPPERDDYTAGSQQSSSQSEQDVLAQVKPVEKQRKRKVSPSFQSERMRSSPPADTITFVRTDEPDKQFNTTTTSVQTEERDPSAFEQHIDNGLGSVENAGKGKEKERCESENDRQEGVAELQREREIRARHRVTTSDPISASLLISALESQLSEHVTQRDNRLDNRLVTTPPISHRRSPSSSSSSPSTDRHRRFSVDELGSPCFRPRLAPTQKHGPRNQAASDIELRDAPPVHQTIVSSPNDIKVEDAPKPITPHHIPGSWIPSRIVHFGEFKTEIPSPRRQAVDNEIDLPDAPEEELPSNEIDLPDAPGERRRAEAEQLFYSEGAQLRVSLPPTPEDRKNDSTKHSFTPTYPPPTTYGSSLPTGRFNAARYVTTKGNYRHKSTQTEDDMTAKKMEALEDMMKQMMIANDKRDAAMQILLARTAPQASQPADAEQERKRAIFEQLEEERLQKLSALEAELKDKYEAAGFAYEQTSPSSPSEHQGHTPGVVRQEPRAEHVKISQIGLVQPLPAHAEWTGQAHQEGDNSTYVSFKAWLDHLQAVLEQKDTQQWKSAVLDCAALSCLRGRALDWWNACSPSQQWNLRHDFTLEQWHNLGKPLFRNQTLTRKEARDRKRQHGETLSDYAWRKLAMLNEAYGRERPVLDVISDIKEGMSIADQEKIITDLQNKPSMSRFLEELARLDSIRGPMFKDAMNSGKRRYNTQQDRSDTRNKAQYSTPTQKVQPLSATYDPKQLAFRQNPLTPSASKQWSYVFPNGRTIFLSTPCSHCGAKHFNFECKKRDEQRTASARAAMQFGEGWDEGGSEESDEGEDFMEEACAAYTCVQPSAWAYYADPRKQETPRQSTRIDTEPWDETTGLSGN
jgi:hypothetical protein